MCSPASPAESAGPHNTRLQPQLLSIAFAAVPRPYRLLVGAAVVVVVVVGGGGGVGGGVGLGLGLGAVGEAVAPATTSRTIFVHH